MFSFSKTLATTCAAVALAAVAITPAVAAHPHYGNAFNLLVYTHMGGNGEGALIQQLATQWATSNGGTARVVEDSGSLSDYITLAKSAKAPDVYFGSPDDDTAKYVLAGLLAPVPSSIFNPDNYVPAAVTAVTYNGKAYAVPVALDTYALVYNKRLVKTPPTSFNQVLSLAATYPNSKGQTYGFLWDITNFYYSYTFIRGNGGYVFRPTATGYNTSDIGLGNPGTVKALTLFQSLVRTKKLIPADIDYGTAQGLFQKGKVAMFIDGTWDIGSNRKALGKDFGAIPLSALLPGAHQFAGVFDSFVGVNSPNKSYGFSFLQYMAAHFAIPELSAGGRLPTRKADLTSSIISNDAVLSAYAKAAAAGDLLPNVPEMGAVWTPGLNAIKLVITGKETPQEAATNMLKQVQQGIAQLG